MARGPAGPQGAPAGSPGARGGPGGSALGTGKGSERRCAELALGGGQLHARPAVGTRGDSRGGVTDMGLGTHKHGRSLAGAVLPAGRRVPGQNTVTPTWKRSPGREKNALGTLPPALGERKTGLEVGPLVWSFTIIIFLRKAVVFTEARQSPTPSSEGHCPCPSNTRVKPPTPPKRAGVCGALVSNWDEVLVANEARPREGDQGWLPAPAPG